MVTGESLMRVAARDQDEIAAQVAVEKGVECGSLDGVVVTGGRVGLDDCKIGDKGREAELFTACRDCGMGQLRSAVEVLGKVWGFKVVK